MREAEFILNSSSVCPFIYSQRLSQGAKHEKVLKHSNLTRLLCFVEKEETERVEEGGRERALINCLYDRPISCKFLMQRLNWSQVTRRRRSRRRHVAQTSAPKTISSNTKPLSKDPILLSLGSSRIYQTRFNFCLKTASNKNAFMSDGFHTPNGTPELFLFSCLIKNFRSHLDTQRCTLPLILSLPCRHSHSFSGLI